MNRTLKTSKVRRLREAANWSQEELAHAAGVSARTIQRIENGADASLETRRALASVFGVVTNELAEHSKADPPNLTRGRNWGIGSALFGFVCAFAGVSHGLISGSTSGFTAGVTLGILGVLTGIFCAGISIHYERARKVA